MTIGAATMSSYRRVTMPGGTWFFTVVIADREQSLLTERIDALRAAWLWVRQRHPFTTEAVVILPDHLHAIWTLPQGDTEFPMRWKLIKEGFSRRLPQDEPRSASRLRQGERGIWQRRYWEHAIRDRSDLNAHTDYVHFNPVKHAHAQRAADWPYSSFHRFVREGRLSTDWASEAEPTKADE